MADDEQSTAGEQSGDGRSPAIGVSARKLSRAMIAIGALSAILTAVQLLARVRIVDPGGRAAIEATITLIALLSAGLFMANFERARALPELLLTCTLIAVSIDEIVYYAAPTFMSRAVSDPRGGSLTTGVIVALVFAAAAFAPEKAVRGSRGVHVTAALGLSVLMVLLIALPDHLTGKPLVLTLETSSAGLLAAGGIGFLRRCARGQAGSAPLAAASFLLIGAEVQYFALGAVGTDWVTPGEGLRLAASCAWLSAAGWRYAVTRRGEAYAAVVSERERIARDLHDGLAQDLACIAAQIQRLGRQLGREDPMLIAARHALATTPGTIADLAASTAPTIEAALRMVAAELEHRFQLAVEVRVEEAPPGGTEGNLDPARREHLVRIAREAIVNAALHGGARHVDVRLRCRGGELTMNIADDGSGITDGAKTGAGLRTLRARAAALGGRVSTRPREDGGTELELLVS